MLLFCNAHIGVALLIAFLKKCLPKGLKLNVQILIRCSERLWDEIVLDELRRYIEIPAKSKDFDPDWYKSGFISQAVNLVRVWCESHAPPNTTIDVISGGLGADGKPRTPLLLIDVLATGGSKETVLMYGHLDKQPEMTGWNTEGLGLEPWKAVDIRDENGHRLYGRGGADDGYAVFAALTSILCLENQGIPHARCVIMVETGEESGSPDLPHYLEIIRKRIEEPSLIIALDSGCGTYDRLWLTTSLRGLVILYLEVHVLTEGVHSGDAGGVVPDSDRIIRMIMQTIENVETGGFFIPELYANIPEEVRAQALLAAQAMGPNFIGKFPWAVNPTRSIGLDRCMEQILDRTWRPAMATTGADGFPAVKDAGNTLRPMTGHKYSIRIPPTVDHAVCARAVDDALKRVNIPSGVVVNHRIVSRSSWLCPSEVPWLTRAVDTASLEVFGKFAVRMGEGWAIPFMAQLSDAFPNAQFVITGVLGAGSNAHGPNEFLHVDYAKSLTASIAHILCAHAVHR